MIGKRFNLLQARLVALQVGVLVLNLRLQKPNRGVAVRKQPIAVFNDAPGILPALRQPL